MVPKGNNGVGAELVDLVVVAVGDVSVIRFTTVGIFEFRVFSLITLTVLPCMEDEIDVGV